MSELSGQDPHFSGDELSGWIEADFEVDTDELSFNTDTQLNPNAKKELGDIYADEVIKSIQEDDMQVSLHDDKLSDEELHDMDDSIENVIPYEELAVELRNHLKQLGLKNASSINGETIRELNFEYLLDKFRSEALFLHTRSLTDRALGLYFPVTYKDIVQQSKKFDVDKLQRQQSFHSAEILEEHGLSRNKVREWSLLGSDTTKRTMYRIAWLLENEPSLGEYSKFLTNRAKNNGVTIENITLRCLQIMEEECRNHEEARYVAEKQTDIERKVYRFKGQRLENTRVLAELAFVELQNHPIAT